MNKAACMWTNSYKLCIARWNEHQIPVFHQLWPYATHCLASFQHASSKEPKAPQGNRAGSSYCLHMGTWLHYIHSKCSICSSDTACSYTKHDARCVLESMLTTYVCEVPHIHPTTRMQTQQQLFITAESNITCANGVQTGEEKRVYTVRRHSGSLQT